MNVIPFRSRQLFGVRITFNFEDGLALPGSRFPWSLGDTIQIPQTSIPERIDENLRSIVIEFEAEEGT